MAKYHVGPNGPGRCGAQIACPFQPGGSKDDGVLASVNGVPSDYHFATQEDAQKAFEKKLEVQYGKGSFGFQQERSRARKRNQSLKQAHYRNLDYAKVLSQNGRPLRAALVKGAVPMRVARNVARGGGKFVGGSFGMASKMVNGSLRMLTGRRPRRLNMKSLLMTKYWMPDIRSNKWR